MNPWLIGLIVVTAAVLAMVAFAYVAPPSPHVGDRSKLDVVLTADKQRLVDTVSIPAAELAKATCEDGHPCWIAVNGVVYDMASFKTWAKGRHHGVEPGADVTEKFVGSGHARAILEKLPVVGRYAG